MSISSISRYSGWSNYSALSEPDDKKKIEIARKRLLTRVGGMGNLPGLTHAICAPLKAPGDLKSVYTAVKSKDRDSIFHTILRLFQNSSSYFSAIASVMMYAQRIFPRLTDYIPRGVEMGGSILGLISCAIEAVIEGFDFSRATHFRNSALMSMAKFLNANDERLRKDPLGFATDLEAKYLPRVLKYLTEKEAKQIQGFIQEIKTTTYQPWAQTCSEEIERISMASLTRAFAEKYFNEKNFAKQLSLERIVGTFSCEGLDVDLLALSDYLKGYGCQEELKAAKEIFQFLNDQALKKQIVHVLGICAAIVTGVAIGLGTFTGIGTAALVTIIVLGILLSLARYAYLNGIHSHTGWYFDWMECLPDSLQELILEHFA